MESWHTGYIGANPGECGIIRYAWATQAWYDADTLELPGGGMDHVGADTDRDIVIYSFPTDDDVTPTYRTITFPYAQPVDPGDVPVMETAESEIPFAFEVLYDPTAPLDGDEFGTIVDA
jgi:hypothetical protein